MSGAAAVPRNAKAATTARRNPVSVKASATAIAVPQNDGGQIERGDATRIGVHASPSGGSEPSSSKPISLCRRR
jgi:hypothetical protein